MTPPSFDEIWPDVEPITLLNRYKAKLIHDLLLLSPPGGSAVECGIFRGGITVMLAKLLHGSGRVTAYDSFQGLPAERSEVETAHYGAGHMPHSEAALRETLRRHGVEAAVDVVPGWFCDTMRGRYQGPARFVHVDCDVYFSVKTCLEYLYDSVADGGILVFDDYFDQGGGVEAAVNEHLAKTGEILHAGYGDQVYVVKSQTWEKDHTKFQEPVLETSHGVSVSAMVPWLDPEYLSDLRAGKITPELPGGSLDNAEKVAERLLFISQFHRQVLDTRS
jgi:predicted O-methyltransferase YrrM